MWTWPSTARTQDRGTDRPPPLIGEHTDEVLAEFGFPEEEIAGLRREGAI